MNNLNEMETDNYYCVNLETGKLNIFTTKPFYDQLPVEEKTLFTRFCLWSKNKDCWISKGKANNCIYLKARLNDLKFSDRGHIGEKLSFEESIAAEQKRAGQRAERSERYAENADKRSDELFKQAKSMASVIPFGQPILVGHHSENRDRNYRNRISNKFDQSFKEQEKVAYYANKVGNAKYTADGEKFKNPFYLSNRIKDCGKVIRLLERRLEGRYNVHSPVKEISEQDRTFYKGRLIKENEKLDYYTKCMKAIDPEYNPTDQNKKSKQNKKGI